MAKNFLLYVEPKRVETSSGILRNIRFTNVTIENIEDSDDPNRNYASIVLTRNPVSGLNSETYSEIVLHYRDPRIEVSQPYGPDSTVRYFKKLPRSLPILKELNDEELAAIQAADAKAKSQAQTAAAAINTAAAAGMAAGVATAGTASMAIIVKYFQVVDILTNTMGKINV